MTALADFLLAQIAEDEERARRHVSAISDRTVVVYATRMLAECEAKRRIVGMAIPSGWHEGRPTGSGYVDAWWDAMTELALPYADHPDYREEWRP